MVSRLGGQTNAHQQEAGQEGLVGHIKVSFGAQLTKVSLQPLPVVWHS